MDRRPAGAGACLKAFDSTLSRIDPFERFEKRIEYLEIAVKGKTSPEEIMNALDVELVRKNLLQLQGLFKIYEAIPASKHDLKLVSEARKDIKNLEGAIGGLQRAEDVLKRSRAGGADEKILTALEADYKLARVKVLDELRESEWIPNPLQHLKELKNRLSHYDFKKKASDQELQVEALLGLVKDYRKEIREMEPYFESKRFSHEDLELGPHSARRALRWVSAIIQASEGLYYHVPQKGKERQTAELETTLGESKYFVLLPPMKGARPIGRFDMLVLMKFVSRLGELKDFKESQLDLRDALVKHGLAKDAEEAERTAYKIMEKKFGAIDVEAEAKALYREYQQIDPLKSIIRSLEAKADD